MKLSSVQDEMVLDESVFGMKVFFCCLDESVPDRFKHHRNSTRRPPRERHKKNENGGGRGKKKREIWAPHPSGPTPFGTHTFSGFGPTF